MRHVQLLKNVWHSFGKAWTTMLDTTRTPWWHHTITAVERHRYTEKLPGHPIFRDFSVIKRMRMTVCTRRSSSIAPPPSWNQYAWERGYIHLYADQKKNDHVLLPVTLTICWGHFGPEWTTILIAHYMKLKGNQECVTRSKPMQNGTEPYNKRIDLEVGIPK